MQTKRGKNRINSPVAVRTRSVKIADALEREAIVPNLNSSTKPEVIEELSEVVSSLHSNISREKLTQVLKERERLCSTAVDSGVAIPHGKLAEISNIIIAFGRSREGIDFESLDGNPSHLFILLLAPETSAGAHLKLLARISKIFKHPSFRTRLMETDSRDKIYDLIIEEDEKY